MSAEDSNEHVEEVPPSHLHPKLMTNRGAGSNPNSARLHTPRSARSDTNGDVPTNAELSAAGIAPQDGATQQLSARRQESGSLAGPREVSAEDPSKRVAVPALALGGIGQPLHLSEPRQRRIAAAAGGRATGTPREQHPTRHAAPQASGGGAVVRPSRGGSAAGTPRAVIRPGRTSSASNARSQTPSSAKHQDAYAHVTSVVSEYRHNHISALEAQYKAVRTHGSLTPGREDGTSEQRSASRPLTDRAASARRGSSQPRYETAGFIANHNLHQPLSPSHSGDGDSTVLHGLPRAAYDAPHIKYAEALRARQTPRTSAGASHGGYSPSPSMPVASSAVPQAAQHVPERLRYTAPTDEERQRRKDQTLRLLEDWRERQKAKAKAKEHEYKTSATEAAAVVERRSRTPVKNRARTRSRQRPEEPPMPTSTTPPSIIGHKLWDGVIEAASETSEPAPRRVSARRRSKPPPEEPPMPTSTTPPSIIGHKLWDGVIEAASETSEPAPRRVSARRRSKPPPEEPPMPTSTTPPSIIGRKLWDGVIEAASETSEPAPRAASARTPRSAREHGKKSRASSRASCAAKGRKSRGKTPPSTARGESAGGANPTAFRRKLVFNITAPTVSIA